MIEPTISSSSLSAKGRPLATQVRLYWATMESPGLAPKDYAEILGVSRNAIWKARQSIKRRQVQQSEGLYDISKFCPYCFERSIILDHGTNRYQCTNCGAELPISPFIQLKPDVFSSQFALSSIIDHNLGSDPNKTIVELRYQKVRIPGRQKAEDGWPARPAIEDTYLHALGNSSYLRFKVKGEDDKVTRKALTILSWKLRTVDLKQPVYARADRMGRDLRKCLRCQQGPKHLGELTDLLIQEYVDLMADELRKRVKRMQGRKCLESIVDEVVQANLK